MQWQVILAVVDVAQQSGKTTGTTSGFCACLGVLKMVLEDFKARFRSARLLNNTNSTSMQ
jgi:hypothetical protein